MSECISVMNIYCFLSIEIDDEFLIRCMSTSNNRHTHTDRLQQYRTNYNKNSKIWERNKTESNEHRENERKKSNKIKRTTTERIPEDI